MQQKYEKGLTAAKKANQIKITQKVVIIYNKRVCIDKPFVIST